jgi:hypothetical protein
MQTLNLRRFALLASGALLFTASVLADQTVNTGIPGGDGKTLLESGKDPVPAPGGAILVRDTDCAKKAHGDRLKSGKPNPAYTKCVHEKLEKAKKKGHH